MYGQRGCTIHKPVEKLFLCRNRVNRENNLNRSLRATTSSTFCLHWTDYRACKYGNRSHALTRSAPQGAPIPKNKSKIPILRHPHQPSLRAQPR